jgi:L-ribulose-5-phosphate 4-epimerase
MESRGEKYKKEVSNIITKIFKNNLSKINFGNASIFDRKNETIYIKSSGTYIDNCKSSDIVSVKLSQQTKVLQSKKRPSVDLPIHIALYKYNKNITSIIHTHSLYASVYAQLNREVPCYGTTHSDYFRDIIPISNKIKNIKNLNYENELSRSILDRLKQLEYFPRGILIRDHGVLSWSENSKKALENAIAIEEICKLAYLVSNNKFFKGDKFYNDNYHKKLFKIHYDRKNSNRKYYGQ